MPTWELKSYASRFQWPFWYVLCMCVFFLFVVACCCVCGCVYVCSLVLWGTYKGEKQRILVTKMGPLTCNAIVWRIKREQKRERENVSEIEWVCNHLKFQCTYGMIQKKKNHRRRSSQWQNTHWFAHTRNTPKNFAAKDNKIIWWLGFDNKWFLFFFLS